MQLGLPTPPTNLQTQSQKLQQQIIAQIKAQGSLSFADYMHACLYTPGYGYYSSTLTKLGAAGDFITAPEISPIFSYCLANFILKHTKQLPQNNILEIGAGRGLMAAHILQYLQQNAMEISQYYILEVSADLRAQQRQHIADIASLALSKVIWLDSLPENFNGIILANELLDAMPVHIFQYQEGQWLEQSVTVDKNNQFQFVWQDTLPQSAKTYLASLMLPWENGYTSEINLAANAWLKQLYQSCQSAIIVCIDYGFEQATYYHPDRHQGTLMCHYQHLAHTDPFFYPGLQDITAHVNFSLLADTADQLGFKVECYLEQAQFLLAQDILSFSHQNTAQGYQDTQAIKKLLLPSEMGELFKVMILSKNIEELEGLSQQQDLRHRL